ncbi:helix-turn-helix domain-containing protein [Candidatus Spongiihabitans sp.]|uniref:helix-turn-helix domain-containing protein n=1 Tax=Candidatus Spongiihabitans sp. TaxID=3101308 RepID=UPI003C6F6795
MTSKHAQERLKILGCFSDYGAAATCDAFNVSRRTLYRWKQCAKLAATRQP